MKYKNEEEFLKNYNSNRYEKLSITADMIIFSVADGMQENYRKLNEKHFSVLLVKRSDYPFKDKWCLPGGFVKANESIDDAAKRILITETNLHDIYMEQLYTFGSIDRDPRTRVVSTAYMALVDKNKLSDNLANEASWFNVDISDNGETMQIVLDNEKEKIKFKLKKEIVNKTTDKYNYISIENENLAFDHDIVIAMGIERLKNKIEYTDIVFNMMPKYFTLGELQQVYEVILGKKLLDPAFRRIIASKVEQTDKIKVGGGHRPSKMFRYKSK